MLLLLGFLFNFLHTHCEFGQVCQSCVWEILGNCKGCFFYYFGPRKEIDEGDVHMLKEK